MRRVLARRQHYRDYRQCVFAGEVEIALVVRRAAENGAGAVFHQHEIGDIDRHLPRRIERVDGLERGAVAALLGRLDDGFAGAEPVAFGDELGEPRVVRGEALCQRMVRRQRQERGAVERVGAGREHLDRRVLPGNPEQHAGALGAADPVLLHQPDALGPAVERLQRSEQLLAERGDAQVPLRQQPLLDQRAGAPAASVDDLLVGQDRVLDRVPVDPGFLAVGEARREEVEEHLLLVAVVFGVAGGDLARPVIGKTHALELARASR